MSISPFFLALRTAYQSEIDDLAFDSEGRDVLMQRLSQRRAELGFLLQMIEPNPEMVAVVFHQGFEFRSAALMDQLLSRDADQFPDWHSLAGAFDLPAWAQELSLVVLREPMGAWFLTVAAGLEYMYHKSDPALAVFDVDADDDSVAGEGGERGSGPDHLSSREEAALREREEAGADWMVEQGFDRKE
jgi:hypothetical protein